MKLEDTQKTIFPELSFELRTRIRVAISSPTRTVQRACSTNLLSARVVPNPQKHAAMSHGFETLQDMRPREGNHSDAQRLKRNAIIISARTGSQRHHFENKGIYVLLHTHRELPRASAWRSSSPFLDLPSSAAGFGSAKLAAGRESGFAL